MRRSLSQSRGMNRVPYFVSTKNSESDEKSRVSRDRRGAADMLKLMRFMRHEQVSAFGSFPNGGPLADFIFAYAVAEIISAEVVEEVSLGLRLDLGLIGRRAD